MAFLSSVAGYVVTAMISAIFGWLLKVFHSWYTNVYQNKQAADQAQQSVQPLKDAQSADDISKATDSALGGL